MQRRKYEFIQIIFSPKIPDGIFMECSWESLVLLIPRHSMYCRNDVNEKFVQENFSISLEVVLSCDNFLSLECWLEWYYFDSTIIQLGWSVTFNRQSSSTLKLRDYDEDLITRGCSPRRIILTLNRVNDGRTPCCCNWLPWCC